MLITLSLSGLDYYQNYYQCLLLSCVTLACLGWIAGLLLTLLPDPLPPYTLPHQRRPLHTKEHEISESHSKPIHFIWQFISFGGYKLNSMFILLVIFTIYLIYVQLLPQQFYIYCLLPQLLWWMVIRHHSTFISALRSATSSNGLHHLLGLCCLYLLGIEILVLSFFYRFVLSIGMIGLCMWPIVSCGPNVIQRKLRIGWFFSCGLLAVFPMLPVVGREANYTLVTVAGWLWLFSTAYFAHMMRRGLSYSQREQPRVEYVGLVQLAMLPLVIWNLHTTAASIHNKQGLLAINQILSWLLFGVSMLLPMLGSQWLLPRLLNIGLSLAVSFLLLSASHEGFFLLALSYNMVCWLQLENRTADSKQLKLLEFKFSSSAKSNALPRSVNSRDFRRAYFFLFYIILSFFGTGNVASVNSFDPTWVRCFLTVFSPFLMTVLILWKTMVPFLTVTCVYRALNVIVQAPTRKLFLIVLVFCDTMGLHFLHLVKNRGSWLDIGTSISHFVIVQTIILFLVVLYGLAQLLTGTTLWPHIEALVSCWGSKPSRVAESLELGVNSDYKMSDNDIKFSQQMFETQILFRDKRHAE